MEDEKLAAYYDDLTRRGGGAAKFKQGLGFSSSTNDDVPSRGSALPTTSSFLSSFVKASSPSKTAEFDKQAQLQSIQNKLSKKPKEETRIRSPSRRRSRSRSPIRDRIRDNQSKRRSRSRSRSRDKIRDKHSKLESRSRSRSRDRHSRRRSRSRSGDRRSRKRSRSRDDGSRHKYRSRSRSRSREKNRERSKRRRSPEDQRSVKGKKPAEVRGGGGGGIDFAKLIDGYDNMTPAERVKAKMKLQLSKTAENDESIGKGAGWERFDFDKDAPLDDEEIEATEDDAVLVKHIGQSFRFSAVEARKEEEMKSVHDEAMFGAPSYSYPPPAELDDEAEEKIQKNENIENTPITSLLSDQVVTMQKKGSWRDRARKP